jgi:hypothetical protein
LLSCRQRHRSLRLKAFSYYGYECTWCKENDFNVLVLDHIKNDGARDRGKMGATMYGRIVRSGKKFKRFQAVCANCNMAKVANQGVLPKERYNKYK